MSGNQPAKPQQRELEIMRVLFDRRLKDRAIALSDSRWPGSGKMVDLAYEWGELEPAERRERLSAIGPDEIARLREFAELNPELSSAVDELDRRGVLPHLEAAAAAATASAAESRQRDQGASATTPEQTGSDAGSGGATADSTGSTETPTIDTQAASGGQSESPSTETEAVPEPEYDFEDMNIDKLNVDMPNLDLGLPSTSDFLSEEQNRREEASQATDEAMERVRKNLDQATQRAFDRSASMGMPKMPDIPRPTLPSVQSEDRESATGRTTTRAIDAPSSLAHHLENHVVARVRPGDPVPTLDELVALANDLQIGFSEHTVTLGNRREAFGGLVVEYGSIEVQPGSISKAIARPNLVVIHGRLAPQLADRIEEGFLDIPGTRASVKVHPKARVVVLGDT